MLLLFGLILHLRVPVTLSLTLWLGDSKISSREKTQTVQLRDQRNRDIFIVSAAEIKRKTREPASTMTATPRPLALQDGELDADVV